MLVYRGLLTRGSGWPKVKFGLNTSSLPQEVLKNVISEEELAGTTH